MAETGEPLSEREMDVLRCVSGGASNKEIAAELTISENTVKVHLRNIYTKLGVSSRTEATTAAMQEGYLTVPGQANMSPAGGIAASVPLVHETVPVTLEQAPAAEISTDASQNTAKASAKRNWRTVVLITLLVLAVIVVIILGWQLAGQTSGNDSETQALESSSSYAETGVGDSRWLSSRPMPEGRAHMAVATVGLDVYQIGGETQTGVDGKVTVFNSRDLMWREAAEKPTAVADASAAELYGELYVAGGRTTGGETTAVVEAYSPAQDAWRPIAALPRPLAGAVALTDGAFLYVVGGWDGEVSLASAFVYDPSANSWRPLPDMPQASAFASGGVLTGSLVIAGGTDGDQELAACQRFDPTTETWSACPDLLLPRAGAGSAVLLNKLYVIGGGLDSDSDVSFSEVYDPKGGTWQIVNTPMLDEQKSWPFAGVGNVETRIYALGGRQGNSFKEDTYVYAPLVYQTFIPAATSGDEE